jgi:hypothetical protein
MEKPKLPNNFDISGCDETEDENSVKVEMKMRKQANHFVVVVGASLVIMLFAILAVVMTLIIEKVGR